MQVVVSNLGHVISHLVHSEIKFKPVKLVKNKNNKNQQKQMGTFHES